jgi:hypothetical protein
MKLLGRLRPEFERRLNAVGFPWVNESLAIAAEKWAANFAKLARFHQKFGHCWVPAGSPQYAALSNWLRGQRNSHNAGELKPEYVARLEALGVAWDPRHCPDGTWNERVAELVAFRERFGHCRVPLYWPENLALGAWVRTQRNHCLHLLRREPERFAQLEAVGFVWGGNRAKIRWL